MLLRPKFISLPFMRFLEFFLNRTMLVNVLLVAIFGLAFMSVRSTKRNVYPEVDLATMIISTIYPGASPKDVEQNVTRLIEDELKGIPGIRLFKSVSSENVSKITVEIDINYPRQDEVKDDIRRAVERVTDLPEEVVGRPQIRDLKSSELPVITIGIASKDKEKLDYGQIRQTAKIIEKELKQVKGVSKIDKYGYRDHEYHVNLNPKKLEKYYIALNDILYALSRQNVRSSGGNLESYRTQRNILTLSQFSDIKDVENVIIRSSFEGGYVRIKDVGKVEPGFQDEKMRTIFNGGRGISLVVKKSTNSDLIQVVDIIQEYVADKGKHLPPGLTLTAVDDNSLEVRNRLDVVTNNAFIGFILVVIVLIVFLDLRSSILIAISIPTSFAITLIIMPYFDTDINAISLAAMIIALGMIVDQSIVISENSIIHMLEGKGKMRGILEGTMEVVLPVIASVATTVLSFAPMFAMSGTMGRFIFVIPVVIILSLVGSLLNCFLIMPNHLSHSLAEPDGSEEEERWQDRFFKKISVPYEKIMGSVLRHRYITIITAVAILVGSMIFAGKNVPVNIFPTDGADTFFVYVEMTDDATFDYTDGVIRQIEQKIDEIPKDEFKFYTVKLGTQNTIPLAVPIGGQEHLAYVQVTLVAHSERNRDATIVMDELRKKVETIKDKRLKEVRFQLKKPGPPGGKPIEIHVHADDDKVRKMFVDKMVAELSKVPNVKDVNTTAKLGRQEYKLDLNYKRLAQVGLTVQDVANTLRIAFKGIKATSIVAQNEEVQIRVRFPLRHRHDVRNVLDLNIRSQQGRLIPIKAFAGLSKTRAETSIHHKDGDVTTTIFGEIAGKGGEPPQKIINALLAKFTPELKDYPGVRFSVGGEAEKTKESIGSLGIAFAAGVIAIYLVLTLLFNSLSQPILILLAIPFGLIGVIWAFYFHGRPFSFMGLIGVVGLSGIVVNNSLMMVEFINKLVVDQVRAGVHHSRDLIPTVVEGASRRLRPIIITTITTVTGLLPTAYGVGGSDPFIEPMVLAIAWGLIASTNISLILIPALYLANYDLFWGIKTGVGKVVDLVKGKRKQESESEEEEQVEGDESNPLTEQE